MEVAVELIFLVFIIVLGLVLRYIPHMKYYFPSTPDTFFTLQKFIDPEYEKEIVTYPEFLHQIFRFFLKFTDRFPDRVLNRLTPLFDFFTSLVLYIFLRWTFGIEIALISTLLFMITPFAVRNSITLSSRPFGLFLFTCSLLFLILPLPYNWFAIFPVALTFLTHRLSTQTLFVIFLGFSFVDWQVALIFVFGFSLAILISRGHYLRILRNHITTVIKYIRGKHYPNRRFLGIILVPTILGFVINVILRYIQLFISFPIIIYNIVITPTTIINPYFEILLLIWGLVCIVLLLFWFAGEAYKHTYLACIPFAVFSVLLFQNSPAFSYLILLLISGCLILSLYFSIRFQHLPKDLILVLQKMKTLPEPVYFVINYGYLRAAEYFSGKKGIQLDITSRSPTEFVNHISQELITHAIVNKDCLKYAIKFTELFQSGSWLLFSTNSRYSNSDPRMLKMQNG
jgi:hypothetical protein